MTVLKAIAHLNELTEETTNDYYLLPDIKDDKPDEIGVCFTYEDEVTVVRVPATHLSPNTPKKLQFVLPAEVSAGNWKVKVATQATGNSKTFTENVREYVYPNTITVV
jgi:hypothetical protein